MKRGVETNLASHAFGTKMDGHQGVSDGRQLLQWETTTMKKRSGTCHTFLTLAVSPFSLCLCIFEDFINGSVLGEKLS